jgi:hypothetical protein
MGLKGYRLWVMSQLDCNVQSPTTDACASAGNRSKSKTAAAAGEGAEV